MLFYYLHVISLSIIMNFLNVFSIVCICIMWYNTNQLYYRLEKLEGIKSSNRTVFERVEHLENTTKELVNTTRQLTNYTLDNEFMIVQLINITSVLNKTITNSIDTVVESILHIENIQLEISDTMTEHISQLTDINNDITSTVYNMEEDLEKMRTYVLAL